MREPEPLYFIASLKHTNSGHEHITWWGVSHCGYTPVLGERCGRYTLEQARDLNDGYDTLAVPAEALTPLLSREPYYVVGSTGAAALFYDQRGPVVHNTRENWNQLIAASLVEGFPRAKPKPEIFKGKRRSFAMNLEVTA